MKLEADLQAVLEAGVKEQGIPGAVLYVQTPEGIWIGASGFADLKSKKVMRPHDRFRIASMSKMFVATVVLQLAEAEELHLEDAIADWLPEDISDRLPNSDTISIRQLLNHTSGLDDYFGSDEFYEAAKETDLTYIWTATEAIQYAYHLDPLFAPGEEHYYSNTNYILLELIVEEITGNTLAQEIRDRILRPLHLKDTFTEMREKIPGDFVRGYEDYQQKGIREDVTDLNWGNGLGDGGLISTASDVGRFARTLFGGNELLAPETLEEMLDFVADGEGNWYGLGVSSWESEWGQVLGHDGGANGFASTTWYVVDEEITIVVLTNDADNGMPDDLAEGALAIVRS